MVQSSFEKFASAAVYSQLAAANCSALASIARKSQYADLLAYKAVAAVVVGM